MMNENPALDLVTLKKLCVELQRELAFSSSDKKAVYDIAIDVVYLGERLANWAMDQ